VGSVLVNYWLGNCDVLVEVDNESEEEILKFNLCFIKPLPATIVWISRVVQLSVLIDKKHASV
jgi:hypothetical protein